MKSLKWTNESGASEASESLAPWAGWCVNLHLVNTLIIMRLTCYKQLQSSATWTPAAWLTGHVRRVHHGYLTEAKRNAASAYQQHTWTSGEPLWGQEASARLSVSLIQSEKNLKNGIFSSDHTAARVRPPSRCGFYVEVNLCCGVRTTQNVKHAPYQISKTVTHFYSGVGIQERFAEHTFSFQKHPASKW